MSQPDDDEEAGQPVGLPADHRIIRANRRLTGFATDVAEHAADAHDSALTHLLDDLHADLLDIAGDDS